MSTARPLSVSGDLRNSFEALRRLLQKINYHREFDLHG